MKRWLERAGGSYCTRYDAPVCHVNAKTSNQHLNGFEKAAGYALPTVKRHELVCRRNAPAEQQDSNRLTPHFLFTRVLHVGILAS
jgi:formylglycine-generating enzyme required for sulfatase activity